MNADPLVDFADAMARQGLVPPAKLIADGKLHRCDAAGRGGKRDGAYVLRLDGIPYGGFENWRDGHGWKRWRGNIGRTLTTEEESANRAKIEVARKSRDAVDAKRRADARKRADQIWADASPCTGHAYLASKGIQAHGARQYGNCLVLPARDADRVMHSLQFIDPAGTKRFLNGGRMHGCHFLIGEPDRALCIVEGFATGATVHEATGQAVAVAFDAGNLAPAAMTLRDKFPDLRLIVCADDDHRTEGNPGRRKATEAVRAIGGLMVLPDFGTDRPERATDFNDMAMLHGLEAVRCTVGRAIESRVHASPEQESPPAGGSTTFDGPESPNAEPREELPDADVTAVTGVQSSCSANSDVTSDEVEDAMDVTPEVARAIPEENDRPCFRTFDDWHKLPDGKKLKPGVWFFGVKAGRKSDEPPTLIQQWVCSPLHIEAVTSDGQDNNFGRLLRFRNTLGGWRKWAMPMELLRGSGEELRGELLSMGVEIDPSANRLLGQYLLAIPPKRRVHCVLQVGWAGDSFVLPDTVIGPRAEDVIFQSGERGHDEHARAGTLAGWQSEVAARAIGNPVLTLALCASFAGPMLVKCHGESGGVHLVGDSSTGKTTAIEAACATWGGPKFRRSWRATANGMEGVAALHSDCLLALDEISECDPREIGAIVYALGNGVGKQRASRTGSARSVVRWHCIVLSSGERTIGTAMAEGGFRAKAGQSVRLLDVPVAGRFGAWDDLQGFASGTMFADAIKRAAASHYGHAGRAFLEKLTRDPHDCCQLLERIKALPEFSTDGGEGQDRRAAGRFALLALAGEMATKYGITGWSEGAAIQDVAKGLKAWLSLRGRGNDERRQILERVATFIERHGDGRFSNADSDADALIRDRAGWWRADGCNRRLYLFNSVGLREALKGFDFKPALDTLEEAGALPKPDGTGERAKPQRIGGRLVRLYQINTDELVIDHVT